MDITFRAIPFEDSSELLVMAVPARRAAERHPARHHRERLRDASARIGGSLNVMRVRR